MKGFFTCIVALALILVWMLLAALILMVVWNIVVPALFAGPVMTYPVAFAASVLINIIGSAFRSGVK